MIATHYKMVRGYLEPSAAEALASLVAIQLCKKIVLRQVHLERYAQGVIVAVNPMMQD